MQVGVIGTGYVGLVTGVCLAELGHHVVAVDRDPAKVASLRAGEVPIFEPGLEGLLHRAIERGHFVCTQRMAEMAQKAEVIFLAVGTPSDENGDVDLSHFREAVVELAGVLKASGRDCPVIVNKSTVPVGTQAWVSQLMQEALGTPVVVVSNPEFLKEGSAVDDFFKPDRVILGADEEVGFLALEQLYAGLGSTVVRMDPVSAELTKYASNSFLAMRISFMNELSRLAEVVGADIRSIQTGMALDTRIGRHFLNAGFGYGGSCFPKDVQGLAAQSRAAGMTMSLVETVHEVNQAQIRHVIAQTLRLLGAPAKGKVVALWGLAFKPNTDDVREAPALELARTLLAQGVVVQGYDPEGMANAKRSVEGLRVMSSKEAALTGADLLVVATEWPEFIKADLTNVRQAVGKIVDARGVFSVEELKRLGFESYVVGRCPVRSEHNHVAPKSQHTFADARA
jgi:UDPglucose 6-dehydrogenase